MQKKIKWYLSSTERRKKPSFPRILKIAQILFKNQDKTISAKHTKAERIHQQQTSTTRNIKGTSSNKRKMIPDENLDLCKGTKNNSNSKHKKVLLNSKKNTL